ncbi:peroxiredoxin [Methanocella paludicola SANAE]|uniref:Peroxiredoxin n=1 Tax=Methanocella paludicola (strain DSM 17711 / JCM 13418 / NBRC 101707 / SANAE) TaxID=304371 RepID=D1YW83_METPS|nr:peroxiredoxin [Methanocella paludicola]BAI60705.1 peroxiredoxin [Methanocella paludicola SANAE]
MHDEVSVISPQGILSIGMPAPDFEAVTTHGKIKLSQYKGKWVVLFSHPSDFTPVCTTEFIAFAERYEDFKKRNVEIIGLSIDSVYSHIAWARSIQEKTGCRIPFPIIADLDMRVAKAFNMIHPAMSETSAVRAVFFIDPNRILRAMVYYPQTTGRNMDELLRIVDSLQIVDKEKVATPANWRPGDAVIVPAPNTQEGAEKRLNEGYECMDWYLCKKKL